MREVERQDVERIARAALRELGASVPERAEVTEEDQPGHWRIAFDGAHGRAELRIKGGAGTTPQWIREQIVQQYLAQT
jgi:hypothetical protein